jgi:RNA polymerase sigma factor (sigma-70 family)
VGGRFGEGWKKDAARGEPSAWEELVHAEQEPLFVWCLPRCGADRDACQEVVQAAFVSAVERVERYEPERCGGRPREWLRGLALNEIRRLQADQRRASSLDALLESGDPGALAALARFEGDPLSDAVLDTDEARWLVAAAMVELTQGERSILSQRHLDGLEVRQMAKTLGKTEAATDSALRRAERKFAAEFARLVVRAGDGPSAGRMAV